jgi:hypothetical protein
MSGIVMAAFCLSIRLPVLLALDIGSGGGGFFADRLWVLLFVSAMLLLLDRLCMFAPLGDFFVASKVGGESDIFLCFLLCCCFDKLWPLDVNGLSPTDVLC